MLGSTDVRRGALLVGDYGGVSAEASVALGVGANALVGGSDKSVVLQPVSVQGQTGLKVGGAVTGLTLRRGLQPIAGIETAGTLGAGRYCLSDPVLRSSSW